MSNFDHGCPDCGTTNGKHYSGCSYDTSGSWKTAGAGFVATVIFGLFVIVGIGLAVICPPLGGALIILGAELTDV